MPRRRKLAIATPIARIEPLLMLAVGRADFGTVAVYMREDVEASQRPDSLLTVLRHLLMLAGPLTRRVELTFNEASLSDLADHWPSTALADLHAMTSLVLRGQGSGGAVPVMAAATALTDLSVGAWSAEIAAYLPPSLESLDVGSLSGCDDSFSRVPGLRSLFVKVIASDPLQVLLRLPGSQRLTVIVAAGVPYEPVIAMLLLAMRLGPRDATPLPTVLTVGLCTAFESRSAIVTEPLRLACAERGVFFKLVRLWS